MRKFIFKITVILAKIAQWIHFNNTRLVSFSASFSRSRRGTIARYERSNAEEELKIKIKNDCDLGWMFGLHLLRAFFIVTLTIPLALIFSLFLIAETLIGRFMVLLDGLVSRMSGLAVMTFVFLFKVTSSALVKNIQPIMSYAQKRIASAKSKICKPLNVEDLV